MSVHSKLTDTVFFRITQETFWYCVLQNYTGNFLILCSSELHRKLSDTVFYRITQETFWYCVLQNYTRNFLILCSTELHRKLSDTVFYRITHETFWYCVLQNYTENSQITVLHNCPDFSVLRFEARTPDGWFDSTSTVQVRKWMRDKDVKGKELVLKTSIDLWEQRKVPDKTVCDLLWGVM
jgi:hypothetical protein